MASLAVKLLLSTVTIGATVAIPTSLILSRKNSNKSSNIEIKWQSNNSSQEGTEPSSQEPKVTKPQNCKSLVKEKSSRNLSELLVCPDPIDATIPNVYFYKLDISNASQTTEQITQANRVIGLSYKQQESNSEGLGYQYLEVTLENGKKEQIQSDFISRWAEVKDLNPISCKLISSSSTTTTMQCSSPEQGKLISFDLT